VETSGFTNPAEPGAASTDATSSTAPNATPDYGFFVPAPTGTTQPATPEPAAAESAVEPAEQLGAHEAVPTTDSGSSTPFAVVYEPVVTDPASPTTVGPDTAGTDTTGHDVAATEAYDTVAEELPAGPVGGEPAADEAARSFALVEEPVVETRDELPMSLAIAAQEAAEVDISQPTEPPSVDYSAFNGLLDAPPEDPEPMPAAEEPQVQPTYEVGLDASVPAAIVDDLGVGLADSEAEEHAYHRQSTEVSAHDDIVLVDLLLEVLDRKASDLHLSAGARPTIRINGELQPLEDYPVLTPPVIQRVMYAAITQRQREKFEENLELDFAYSVPGRARFRVNVYRQRDALGAAFRLIPFEIKKLEDLGIPPQVANFASLPRGFVLVTGPTGSGKSTTLASLLDMANRNRKDHIMTVEDPIEFLHRHQQCLVNQREVGEDTWSFQNALKHVLRQDPDIILVGEMRDLETISVALTAAETGHLVFATLHTQDAAQTIDRVIDVFPPHQQQQIRAQLATSIQGVVCQTLAKTADGRGRVVICEVMVATPAVRNLIREGKTHQIYSAMQAGAKFGMQTMDQHLAELVNKGRITYDTGVEKCHHIEDFNRLTGRS
jgi:twitching motility protein PilT